jgi:hypothetical protein
MPFIFNFWRNIVNNIIKLGFVVTVALNAVACGDKTPPSNKASAQPQTANPIAQPALDAVEKAKQVEGTMKKEEVTQKKATDAN